MTSKQAVLVGLTGGIGSGKSTVAQMLAQRGLPIVDADALSRGLTAPGGAAMPHIAQAFGQDMVAADGGLHRERMRELVFAQPTERERLERIIHPLVGQAIQAALTAHAQAGASTIVLDIPLLAESDRWPRQLHRVLVVDCLLATQVQRVMQRSGLTEAQVLAIAQQQASRAQRLAVADWVIYNEGLSLDDLAREVQSLPWSWGQTRPNGTS